MAPITTGVAVTLWTLTIIALGLMARKALRHGQVAEAVILFLMMGLAVGWAVYGVPS